MAQLKPDDFETAKALTYEQQAVKDFLTRENPALFNALDSKGLKTLTESKSEALAFINEKIATLEQADPPNKSLIDEWRKCKEGEHLHAIYDQLGFSDNLEEKNKNRIENFYQSDRFKEIYEELKKEKEEKGVFLKITSKEFGERLKEGSPEDKEIYDLLTDPKYKMISTICWQKSEVKRNTEKDSKDKELKCIDEFFENLDQLKPEERKNAAALLEAFAKKHSQYAEQIKKDWYKDKFKEKLEAQENPDLEKLQDFYNSQKFKDLYNNLSAEIGRAPQWPDIEAALTKGGFKLELQLMNAHEKESMAMWDKVWKKAKEDFEKVENQELAQFLEEKNNPREWDDLSKLAKDFQKRRKRFEGKDRLDWYENHFKKLKQDKEKEWKNQVTSFYSSTLPQIYEQIPKSDKDYVRFKDVVTYLKSSGQEDLAYLLEEKFNKESTAAWDQFWQEKEKDHNNKENLAASKFFEKLDPLKLDDPAQVAALYEADTNNKANNQWFKDKLAEYSTQAKTKLESDHLALVESLPDKSLAKAMHAAFKSAETFADRVKWLDENKSKVSQYAGLIEKNTQHEQEITSRTAEHPDLKKELNKIKGEYNEGKKNYTENFYSPRKYNEALKTLNEKVSERERLVENKVSSIENKTFSQVPKLTDKEKLDDKQFLKALRDIDFYERIDKPHLRKNQRVRDAVTKKNAELHKQWLSHRTQYLEQKNRSNVEKSKTIIRNVKRPQNLPPNIKDYKAFTIALKEKKVYDEVPKGLLKNQKVRAAAHAQNMLMWKEYQAGIENAKNEVKQVNLPDVIKTTPGIQNYQSFTQALKEKGVYDEVPKGLLKNEKVRAAAHAQNMLMWKEYQTEQAKEKATENKSTTENLNNKNLEKAKNTITSVKLSVKLEQQITEKLKEKDPKNPDTFTIALRQIGVYQDVDKSLWNNPEIREQAWQQNLKLQQQFLNQSQNPFDSSQKIDSQQAENNYGFPTNYELNWKNIDARLTPNQKNQGLERFKQMHNRSNIGLQTLMQKFKGPLGNFVFEVLAVMPKDRYEKALNALQDVPVGSATSAQASEWLKVLCTSAGPDYLQKEVSSAWSYFKQNFSTNFGEGKSLEKAWELKTQVAKNTQNKTAEDSKNNQPAETKGEALITQDISSQDDSTHGSQKTEPENQNTQIEDIEDKSLTEFLKPEKETGIAEEIATVETPMLTTESVKDNSLKIDEKFLSDDVFNQSEQTPYKQSIDDLNSSDYSNLDSEKSFSEKIFNNRPKVETATEIVDELFDVKDLLADEMIDSLEEPEQSLTNELEKNQTLNNLAPKTDLINEKQTEKEPTNSQENLQKELETPTEPIDDLEAEIPLTKDTETKDAFTKNQENLEEELAESVTDTFKINSDLDEKFEDESEANLLFDETDSALLEDKATKQEELNESEDLAENQEIAEEDTNTLKIVKPKEKLEVEEIPEEVNNFEEKIITLKPFLPQVEASQTQNSTAAWHQFVNTDDSQTEMDKLKADLKDLNQPLSQAELAALLKNPQALQRLRQQLKQKNKNPEPHWFTTAYQQQFVTQFITVQKFLQELKSYSLYGANLPASIIEPLNSQAEITQSQAKQIFAAFSETLHETHNLKSISLSFSADGLKVNAYSDSKTLIWRFKLDTQI